MKLSARRCLRVSLRLILKVEFRGTFYTPVWGFCRVLAKRLQMDVYREFMKLFILRTGVRSSPDWSVRHSLLMARNLAVAIDAVHEAGHRVGDINESNVLVAPDATLLRIVDADGVQISTGSNCLPLYCWCRSLRLLRLVLVVIREERNRRTCSYGHVRVTVMLLMRL